MTQEEIEHMWKVASNDPNHDTNWHDPIVVKFAKLVAAHTLMNIDPSKFISHQEGFEVGAAKEREAIIDLVAMYGGPVDLEAAIRARGEAWTS